MVCILVTEDGTVLDKSIEKVYAIRDKRKTKDGREYIYKNYEVFIRYDYLEVFGIKDHLYLYSEDGRVFVTSVCPDGSVPMKRLRVYMQRGSSRSRELRPDATRNNKWKRFFILPKMFFPGTREGSKVLFTLDTNGFERFSGVHASLSVELVE